MEWLKHRLNFRKESESWYCELCEWDWPGKKPGITCPGVPRFEYGKWPKSLKTRNELGQAGLKWPGSPRGCYYMASRKDYLWLYLPEEASAERKAGTKSKPKPKLRTESKPPVWSVEGCFWEEKLGLETEQYSLTAPVGKAQVWRDTGNPHYYAEVKSIGGYYSAREGSRDYGLSRIGSENGNFFEGFETLAEAQYWCECILTKKSFNSRLSELQRQVEELENLLG